MKAKIAEFLNQTGVRYSENSAHTHFIVDSCPGCGGKKKLGIDFTKGAFQCFKCGSEPGSEMRGGLVQLGVAVGNMTREDSQKYFYGGRDYRKEIPDIRSSSFFKNILKKSRIAELEGDICESIELPSYFTDLTPDHKEAWEYLKGRGFSDEDIEASHVMISSLQTKEQLNAWAKESNAPTEEIKWAYAMQGRVIFIIYHRARPYGYVARDYTGKRPPENKVLNSKGNFRSFKIWNYDSVRGSTALAIMEGIFSAQKGGMHQSVATFGKLVTRPQMALIRSLSTTVKTVYIVFDVDTDNLEARFLKSDLSAHFERVIIVTLPKILKTSLRFTSDLLEKANRVFSSTIAQTDGIYIHPRERERIKKVLKREDPRLSRFFNSEELQLLNKIIRHSDYKDAGDYSKEEMSQFFTNASDEEEMVRFKALNQSVIKRVEKKREKETKKRVFVKSRFARIMSRAKA